MRRDSALSAHPLVALDHSALVAQHPVALGDEDHLVLKAIATRHGSDGRGFDGSDQLPGVELPAPTGVAETASALAGRNQKGPVGVEVDLEAVAADAAIADGKTNRP